MQHHHPLELEKLKETETADGRETRRRQEVGFRIPPACWIRLQPVRPAKRVAMRCW